ncbi:MAG: MBL fold metallo-hydrolase [Clostridiales bacterium]|nr:MBL fold metallo-hydrolase [Clostridiales bacterium]
MKITVLIENTSTFQELEYEHGLSLFIEHNERNILFDMGQTDAFIRNSRKMGVNLSSVHAAVLSHGHYDHGGGIKPFLAVNSKAPIYLSNECKGGFYNNAGKFIGLDKELFDIERMLYTYGDTEICSGITVKALKNVPVKHKENACGLTEYKNGVFVPDAFKHEQYLIIEENGKRILFSGCAHRSILNIMDAFSPDIFIGGLHLSKIDTEGNGREYLVNVAKELSKYNTKYYVCHCTGQKQYDILKEYLGNSIKYISTGSIVEI